MKRVLLLLAVLLFSAGSGTMMAQQDKAAEKAAKKAEKEARKAAEEAENMALFEQAVQALNDKDFVLEADRVEFKRGRFCLCHSEYQLRLYGWQPRNHPVGIQRSLRRS